MKYNIILLFFLTSCINNSNIGKNSFSYSAKGFAKIENNSVSSLHEDHYVSHNKLRLGTKIRLINPVNKNSLEIINGSVVNYKKEMIGSSFVIENPKATSSCGCGLSFSI